MGVIDDLTRKLKAAMRARDKASKEHVAAADEAARRRKILEDRIAQVKELESAVSILRNNLRPSAPTGENVSQLKPR